MFRFVGMCDSPHISLHIMRESRNAEPVSTRPTNKARNLRERRSRVQPGRRALDLEKPVFAISVGHLVPLLGKGTL